MSGVLDPNLPIPETDPSEPVTPTTQPADPAAGGGLVSEAKHFIRNPLGIIGLFIVLVYSVATTVAGLLMSGKVCGLTPCQTSWLIGFMVWFPVLILVTFTFLVAKHHTKLYAPSDYADGEFLLLARKELEEIETSLGGVSGTRSLESTGAQPLKEKVERMKKLIDDKIAERLRRR